MKVNKFVGPVTRGDVTVAMTEDGKYWDVEAVTYMTADVNMKRAVIYFDHPVLVLKVER